MPDDLRWSWYHHDRNKVHNKCNEPDSSWNHSLSPTHHGITVFHKTGPWWEKKKKKVVLGNTILLPRALSSYFPLSTGLWSYCLPSPLLFSHLLLPSALPYFTIPLGLQGKKNFFFTVLKDLFLLSLPGLSFQTHKAHHSVVFKAWTALLCPLLYYSIRWILLRGFTADTQ